MANADTARISPRVQHVTTPTCDVRYRESDSPDVLIPNPNLTQNSGTLLSKPHRRYAILIVSAG